MMPESELGICDLETGLHHEKLFSCENWRPIFPKKEKARHAVGVSVLLIENDQILLGKRGQKTTNVEARGMLSTPGGRLELEETFTDCAVREFKEETGAELAGDLRIIGIRKHYRFGEHYIMVYVLATDHVGQIGNPEGDDKCEGGWQWFNPEWVLYDYRVTVTEPGDILHLALAEAIRRKASL
jgi:8-oxo-dGTP diphosphatase